MTQERRLIRWLSDGDWHCGSEALWGAGGIEGPMYTFSQRASDINKKEPGRIITRPCQRHAHKLHEYLDTLARAPQQLALAAS